MNLSELGVLISDQALCKFAIASEYALLLFLHDA